MKHDITEISWIKTEIFKPYVYMEQKHHLKCIHFLKINNHDKINSTYTVLVTLECACLLSLYKILYE